LRDKLNAFVNNSKDYPLLSGLICGIFVFVFYYSNNFSAINSVSHAIYFALVFIAFPSIVFYLVYYLFGLNDTLIKYRKHLLFVLIIVFTAGLLSQAIFLTLKKKMLIGLLVLSVLLSIKLFNQYKKLLVLLLFMSVIPFVKCFIHVYEHAISKSWMTLPDDIKTISLKQTPNIYIIQPDGYVSREMLEREPYNHKSDLYGWLDNNEFKVYDGFRSNYPASLASNASMFAMKQHYFHGMINPTFELPNARSVITGDNPVLEILKNNNYHTSFIVQDEYFQQNRNPLVYDYYNVSLDEIPFFSNDNNVKKVVFEDLKVAMQHKVNQPKFYFVEKLLPHHIHYSDPIDTRREKYLKRIDSVNVWLKKTIQYIEEKDQEALIVVLADHGGWLGLENYEDMFSTNEAVDIKSIYSSLLAIRWNGFLKDDIDANLKSSVNLFRVLFSALAENKTYLNHLEDDSSYNLHKENHFFNSVYQVVDTNGNIVFKELSN